MASTIRALGLLTLSVAGFAGDRALTAPQAPLLAPQVQNGRVEHRPVTDIGRDLATLGASAPVWVGWTVPMADGPRDLCNWYSSPSSTVRGFFAESVEMDEARQIAPATTPVPLEAGNGLVVLARVESGALQRVRTLSDDCPIDAGGRTVYWLDGVTPAASLAWLDTLTSVPTSTVADRLIADERRSIASAAVGAIAMHASADADRILERLATDANLRRTAASRMASYRGATGFETLRRLIAAEADDEARRSLVSALGQTRQPGTPDALLHVAREDADARARGDAALAYLRLAGPAGIPDAMALVGPDADDTVVSRVVSGLASMPDGAGLPALITLARTSADLDVKKEAVTALSRSDDPRARALLTEIIKR